MGLATLESKNHKAGLVGPAFPFVELARLVLQTADQHVRISGRSSLTRELQPTAGWFLTQVEARVPCFLPPPFPGSPGR